MSQLIKIFFLILVMELGSASQFSVAALANHSNKLQVWLAATLALSFSSFLGIMMSDLLSKLPFSANLTSGLVLIAVGLFLVVHR